MNVEVLKNIIDNDFSFKDVNVQSLLDYLLDNIGNPDGHIRDDLVYPVLGHLLHDDVLSNAKINEITEVLLSDRFLMKEIDSSDIKHTLTRTFTLLQLVIILYKHREKNILNDGIFQMVLDVFLEYYKSEKIYLGYSHDYGFVHSVAHSADLMTQIFHLDNLNKDYIEGILDEIIKKFVQNQYQFVSDEDERTVNAIEVLINKQSLKNNEIIEFIGKFTNYEKGRLYPEAYIVTSNVKCFLRSLYFRLLDNDNNLEIISFIKENLKIIKEKR